MTLKLFFQAMIKVLLGIIMIGLLLFIPAGSVNYWNGWLLIIILFVPMIIAGIILMIFNPELLKKRLNAKEEESEQKIVIALSGVMFIAAFIFAGLNYRFTWNVLPNFIVYISTGLFFLAYMMYAEVLRENEYLSRTIEVQKDQRVVDTGLYGIVRHPMYSATIILFLSMGLILGSLISFAILLFYIPIIVKRIRNEEEVLSRNLTGYDEYMKKIRYRLIPFIW